MSTSRSYHIRLTLKTTIKSNIHNKKYKLHLLNKLNLILKPKPKTTISRKAISTIRKVSQVDTIQAYCLLGFRRLDLDNGCTIG